MNLNDLGWNPRFEEALAQYAQPLLTPARISFEGRGLYRIITEDGEMPATCTGRMTHESLDPSDLPVVGDWVGVRVLDETPAHAVIHTVLPRKSLFVRKEAGGRTRPQPVAANVDTVFITVGLDANYSLRRIERYLTVAWESGAMPVVLLTKSDLVSGLDERIDQVMEASPGVSVHAVSALDGSGLEALDTYLTAGRTIALLGSSGVGKSTIVNHLMHADTQRTNEVRGDDSRGRHTTTSRSLFVLPSGALVIDTPGMRELQLWTVDEGLATAFRDIEEIAVDCRFSDCRHESEPGCAVTRALTEGRIDHSRMENYRKMRRELGYLQIRQDQSAALAERARWKSIHKERRKIKKQ